HYAKAEPRYKRALAIGEKALRPNHPNLAKLLDNLAELYIKMGRDDEAKNMLARAKRIRASQ
ncbi:MAG: tetratricopeptide repeat protein, partial [candidate division NC10 bacterium]|nr:tetratricopeptide repeat protein [candidate division NC10 bacterium]